MQAHITQEALGGMFGSNAMTVSQHDILVSTTDGTLKVYDWYATSNQIILKTAQNLIRLSI
jgi:hypothetical protein